MQTILLTKLKELRHQFPEDGSQSIHVLADVFDNANGQFKLSLQQESKDHAGERIILIPYNLKNSHWVGILIEFQSDEQIKRAEYIDPVNGIDDVPDGLRKQFTEVYPYDMLQVKSLQKQNDSVNSAALTIDNLLIAANVKLPQTMNCPKEETSILSPTTYIQKEGNAYELSELQQKLNSGLKKYNIQNVDDLDKEMQDTNERIQKFQKQGRKEKAQEEMNFLRELKGFKELSDKIARWISNASFSLCNHKLKLHELTEKLNSGLAKINLRNVSQLREEIRDTEERIQTYQKPGRKENAQDEIKFLNELQVLERISEEICTLIFVSSVDLIHEPTTQPSLSALSPVTEIGTSDEQNKKRLYLEVLRGDMADIPCCAEKTIMELQVHYEERLLEDCTSSQEENLWTSSLEKLRDQIKREELLTDNTKAIFNDLEKHKDSNNYQSIVDYLKKLLQAIRPLNVLEIQRLVREAEKTAESIRGKEIILLIGETGTGKSTTIQFLTGSKMKKTRIEIASGRFLEHITLDGTPKNPQLNRISSSALNKSETRYITPVTVPLKDIPGAYENDAITLCDAPGFSDTAGPEVDIANSLGVIEALKGTESVKLLALSSYKSLGDRGQGIQKLAEILIHMVRGIDNKLTAIVYAFTKYPPETDINALLIDIKRSKVDTNSSLRSNSAFMAVLIDMIEKTEHGAFKINPIKGNPKELIRQLRRIKGIQDSKDVFHFSMTEETRATIDKHVRRDRSGISYAMKNKDNKLLLYYLNDLKILKDLIKKYDIPEAYEQSISSISESISRYCAEEKEKFNRVMISRDGLKEGDIRDYQACVEYLQQIQLTKEHLGPSLALPEILMQNITFHLEERRRTLQEEDLDSPLIEIYLDNFRMLKTSFNELETDYSSCCNEFEKRFDNLVQTAREPILKNDFKHVAEIFIKISKSSHILKNHLYEQINKKYNDIVQLLLQHLNMFSNEVDPILAKDRLNNDDVNILNSYIETLRSAKENHVLQQYISTYIEMLKNVVEVREEYSIDHTSQVYTKDLNEIYDEFITKIIKRFDEIILRMTKLFEGNDNHALESIEKLVEDMNVIRTIPEVESKTARTYYSTVENIRSYMDQLRRDAAEQLLDTIHQQSESINYKQLIRSLAHLKNAQWINSVSPGTYDTSMNQLTEQVIEYAEQLQGHIKKLDLSLKCPDNVCIAHQMMEKIESMKTLEHDFPQLENYRETIFRHFLQCIQVVFDSIEKDFNFSDQIASEEDEKLKQIEESKSLSESSYPIAQPKTTRETELERIRAEKHELNTQLMRLKSHVEAYEKILSSEEGLGIANLFFKSRRAKAQKKKIEALDHLKKYGYESIEAVNATIFKFQTELEKTAKKEKILRNSQNPLQSIIKENESSEEISVSLDETCNTSQLIVKTVQDKTKSNIKREKNKQFYRLNDRFRISTANNALIYIRHCEQITNDCIRALTARVYKILKDYVQQYGNFLEQRINQNFRHGICNDTSSKEDHSQYSQDLEISLNALSSLSKFQYVFECMEVNEKLERWQQEFINYHRILCDKMQHYRTSGENADSFFEAERGMDVLSRVERELTGYCSSEDVTKKIKALSERLANIDTEISKQYNFTDVHNYSINPPKYILAKLKMAASQCGANYSKAYTRMFETIRQNFTSAIENARDTPLGERAVKIHSLSYALQFLPEEFQNSFKLNVDDLKGIWNSTQVLTTKRFLNSCETLENISSFEQTDFVEKAFYEIHVYLDFSVTFDPTVEVLFSENILKNATEGFKKMFQYLSDNSKQFQVAVNEINIFKLHTAMIISKKWDRFLLTINKSKSKHNLVQKLLQAIKKIILYADMISELENLINRLNIQLNVELINDDTTKFEVKRDELFSNIKTTMSTLKAINSKFKDILPSTSDANKLEENLKTKIERIISELLARASKKELSIKDADDFRILKSFDPNANKEPDIAMLVMQIKHIAGTVTHISKSVTWDYAFTQQIPELLAYIFAVWTLKNTQHYNTLRGIEAAQTYLLIPHVGQVVTVFRLLGIGYESHRVIGSCSLINNLVQIGTGEGKSVVLAITACVFALIGVDVNCSCYSEVLSTRDKQDFASVFQALGIEDRIEYSTFNKLCEQFLNEQCNIREKVSNMIVNNNIALTTVDTRIRIRPKVLLIDEVDVFLSDEFYGGMYTPTVYLKNPSIKTLLDSIWHAKPLKTLNSVKALPAYKTCATQFSNWISLFDEAIQDMLGALKSFECSTYVVQDDKIAYVEGESIVDNVVRGYDTVWAYYFENEKGKISKISLETNVGIIINCGTFSYAEMPHDFAYIAGVTGTLKTLAKPETRILKNVYNICKNTYMPSVFGKSNRTYNDTTDVQVVGKSEYFNRILIEINVMCKADRAILIFFESEEKLMTFFNSPELSSIKENVQIITETVSVKERELHIKRASTIGKVTLFTRIFGRGTDFICNNPRLLANGGIHVLQTFFSKELSEEYQIMGRAARHGDQGSYRMILLDNDLEWVLGSTWKEKLSKISDAKLYEAINN
ncbi:unnamed protein product, partial [Rotaria sp. Silwood1]